MRDVKVRVGINSENKIVSIEPINKAQGNPVEMIEARIRIISDGEEYDNIERIMKEGGVYTRQHGRIKEIR